MTQILLVSLLLIYDIFVSINLNLCNLVINLYQMTRLNILVSFILLSSALFYSVHAQQQSANFSEDEKIYVRFIVQKAGILYGYYYEDLAKYIKNELAWTYGSYWNVISHHDINSFYLSARYDENHKNKRYFSVQKTSPYGICIYIVETNNTKGEGNHLTKNLALGSKENLNGGLQFSKTKSPLVTDRQDKAIDQAYFTYSWNSDVNTFAINFRKMIKETLNEEWEVCSVYQSNFGISYTSPYGQWVQFVSDFGNLGSYRYVYAWRNFLSR